MIPKRLFRQIHYWLSIAVFAPSEVIIAAGLVLMLKKEIDWIQPATQRGAATNETPNLAYDDLLDVLRSQANAEIRDWKDIKRIDLRPGKGTAKVTAKNGWEIQIDTSNGNVLSIAYRRSDLIENIHDGSYFAPWVKLYVFLPAGLLLLVMWASGIYLFFIPRMARWKLGRW